MSLSSIRKAISVGVPVLTKEIDGVCGDYLASKQIRVSYKKVSLCTKGRVLELLHMNLMGLMQMESLGGQRYVFVCVADFLRYTWV